MYPVLFSVIILCSIYGTTRVCISIYIVVSIVSAAIVGGRVFVLLPSANRYSIAFHGTCNDSKSLAEAIQ